MSPADTRVATEPTRRSFPVSTRWLRGAVGAVALFVALEALTQAELVSASYLPPASSILGETVELLGRSDFLGALWSTLKACLIGMIIAALIAVPVGLALGGSRLAYRVAITAIEMLRPIPSVALIPLAILLYGRGTEMKVSLIVYACVWPILFNTIYGMRSVDPVAVDTARVFGLGRIQVGLRVYLRSASTFIFTGVKIALSIAVILAVSAELIAGGRPEEGIGIWMLEAREIGNLKRVYAITIVAGLLGLVLNIVSEAVERRAFPWNVGSDGR